MSAFPGLEILAQSPTADAPAWWTIATGVIGVPTALIALIGSFVLIKKTRLESQKFELEIREKEKELAGAHEEGDVVKINQLVAQPILEGRRVQEILLRSIVLFLALQAWALVEVVFGTVTTGVGVGLSSIINRSANIDATTLPLVFSVVAQIPKVGYWLVFFALGGPLLLDVLKQLNISAPKLLNRLERPSRLTYIAIAVLVLATILMTPLLVFLSR